MVRPGLLLCSSAKLVTSFPSPSHMLDFAPTCQRVPSARAPLPWHSFLPRRRSIMLPFPFPPVFLRLKSRVFLVNELRTCSFPSPFPRPHVSVLFSFLCLRSSLLLLSWCDLSRYGSCGLLCLVCVGLSALFVCGGLLRAFRVFTAAQRVVRPFHSWSSPSPPCSRRQADLSSKNPLVSAPCRFRGARLLRRPSPAWTARSGSRPRLV